MHDLIIIGAGIAGHSAAIYAARKKANFIVLTKEIGGFSLVAGEVSNYPGIMKTSGAELITAMDGQLSALGVNIKTGDEIRRIEKSKNIFRITTARDTYEARALIVATGSRPKKLNVPGEDEYFEKGVAYCAVCEGPLFKGKDIAVLGGGFGALEAVDFTKDIAARIYLINNLDEFSAPKEMIDKIGHLKNIEVITKANATEILGDQFVTGIRYEKDGKLHDLQVSGIIISIGMNPNTEFLKGLAELDEHGHVIINAEMKSSVEGLYAAGDCASGHEYQYVIAAAQGVFAFLKAAKYLAKY